MLSRGVAVKKALLEELTGSSALRGSFSSNARMRLDELVRTLPATSVSIKDLHHASSNITPTQALLNGQFLHGELTARRAVMLQQLHDLPPTLSECKSVKALTSLYQGRLTRILSQPAPRNLDEEATFAANLKCNFKKQEGETRLALGQALAELQQGPALSTEDTQLIDVHVDAFFSARVGLRFLVDHYLASKEPRSGWSGCLQLNLSPTEMCRQVAESVKSVMLERHGVAPEVVVHGDPSETFTYVPSHIDFVISELLQNACLATVRAHATKPQMPPVSVVVAVSDQDVTFKVADEGGGIPRSKLHHVWSYLGEYKRWQSDGTIGLGLPLSRIYAKYFGGKLHLTPMEGYGTDCYMKLQRLAHANCENIIQMDADNVIHADANLWRVRLAQTAGVFESREERRTRGRV